MSRLGLRLTPHGRLSVEDQDDGPDIDAAASIRLIDAFARGTGYGLVWLGAADGGGANSLTKVFLWSLGDEMQRAFAASLAAAKVGLQAFLTTLNRAWNLVGRVHFNLAENRRDPDQPFAFMATYTTRLSAQAKVQHVPLGQALREYAGAANVAILAPAGATRRGTLRLAEADDRCRGY